jgi:fermentation-respiration switch protein FrsA (DUF1100 family)
MRVRDTQAVSREEVTFPSGGLRCAAWLYRPQTADQRVPCVVMGHGFSATRHERMPAFAERFVAAGAAVLCFDYRHFGDSEGEPRQLLDIAKQQADWRAAIAYARSLDGVDPDRIALWGSSFSGGHVLAVGADDGRVAAVISQVPFTDGLATARALGVAANLRVTPHAVYDLARALIGRSPHLIPATAPPGETGVMTTPDAEPGMRAVVPEGSTWRNEVTPRVFLRVPLYRPGRRAQDLRCPLFMAVATQDVLTPPGPAATYARQAGDHELHEYDAEHFAVYVGEDFERLVADETAFLVRTLGLPGAASAPAAGERATAAG